MPEAREMTNKRRREEIMLGEIFKKPKFMDRLSSWATDKRINERENKFHPEASSPSFKKDLTLMEMRKQQNIPTRSNISKSVGTTDGEPEWRAEVWRAKAFSRIQKNPPGKNISQNRMTVVIFLTILAPNDFKVFLQVSLAFL
jgi:hypothetical protein